MRALTSSMLAVFGVMLPLSAALADGVYDYPRNPQSMVAAEHFDFPSDVDPASNGGYGDSLSMFSDTQFTSGTPVYTLPHVVDTGCAPCAYAPPPPPPPYGWRQRRNAAWRIPVSRHYITPDYLATTTYAEDGQSYRHVTPAHYSTEWERKSAF